MDILFKAYGVLMICTVLYLLAVLVMHLEKSDKKVLLVGGVEFGVLVSLMALFAFGVINANKSVSSGKGNELAGVWVSIIVAILFGHFVGVVFVRLGSVVQRLGWKCFKKEFKKSLTGNEMKYYRNMVSMPLLESFITLFMLAIIIGVMRVKYNVVIMVLMAIIPFVWHTYKVTSEKMSRDLAIRILNLRYVINSSDTYTSKMKEKYNEELTKILVRFKSAKKYNVREIYDNSVMRVESMMDKLNELSESNNKERQKNE